MVAPKRKKIVFSPHAGRSIMEIAEEYFRPFYEERVKPVSGSQPVKPLSRQRY